MEELILSKRVAVHKRKCKIGTIYKNKGVPKLKLTCYLQVMERFNLN